jgi:hypothetical protein
MLILNAWGKDHKISVELASYAENGNLYVGLVSYDEGCPIPWSDLTVNLSIECKPNCAFIDTNNNGNEILGWLIENNLGKPTGRMKTSGWCLYPEFEFNMDELMKHVTEDYRKGDD